MLYLSISFINGPVCQVVRMSPLFLPPSHCSPLETCPRTVARTDEFRPDGDDLGVIPVSDEQIN